MRARPNCIYIHERRTYPPLREDLLLRRREVFDEPPRPEVDLDDLVQRRFLHKVRLVRLHGRLDDARDVQVLEGALAEHLVRHLVRRVQAPRHRAAHAARGVG